MRPGDKILAKAKELCASTGELVKRWLKMVERKTDGRGGKKGMEGMEREMRAGKRKK